MLPFVRFGLLHERVGTDPMATPIRDLDRDPTVQTGSPTELAPGVEIQPAAWTEAAQKVLPPAAIALIARLQRELGAERERLLAARRERQAAWDAGELPGYLAPSLLPESHGEWRIAPLPADLLRRRVEITGPISSKKMVIQMLSRNEEGVRADAAMLDFEDSMKPVWSGVVEGLANLSGAAAGTLRYVKPAEAGSPEKLYAVDPDDMPLLMV